MIYRMTTTLPVASTYRPAVFWALGIQIILAVFFLSILDGGTLAKTAGAGMVGFWVGVCFVMVRRPRTPTGLDLFYVRWGYFLMLVVAVGCSPWMGVLRGYLLR